MERQKNGELLGLMTLNGFDAFVTIDKNLRHQQNLSRFANKLIVLDAPNNKIVTLIPFIEKLTAILSAPMGNQIVIVSQD